MDGPNIETQLKAEKNRLERELRRVENAIAALDGEKVDKRNPPEKKPPQRDWPDEAVVCTLCEFRAKAPQGLSSHMRYHHPESGVLGSS